MSLARDLCELEGELRRHGTVDPFLPIRTSGLLDVPGCATMLAQLADQNQLDPGAVLRLCLQSLRIQHGELLPKLIDAEFVATLPPNVPGLARPTQSVVREMVARATKEIIVLGYELTDRELVRMLASARSRGVDAIIICDRGRGSVERVLEEWPIDVPRPKIFRDKERKGSAPHASMHAKALLVDENDLLITSANFTFHGLQGNIEFGVRLSGAPASEARKIFVHLVSSQLVEEC